MSIYSRRIKHGLRRARKFVYQRLIAQQTPTKQILFILGCQRSGTTMLSSLFRNDLATRVYTERELGNDSERRIESLRQLENSFEKDRANFIVAKPIVESQRANEILNFFPNAKAVWMFRNFADVVRSARKRFSEESAIRNLRAIADPTTQQTFAAEGVSRETRDIVLRHFSETMNVDDANSLYWYVRNILYYEQKLDESDRVLLCSYERFVANPEPSLADLYDFLGWNYPGKHLTRDVHSRSVRSDPLKDLSSDIARLCNELLARFESESN